LKKCNSARIRKKVTKSMSLKVRPAFWPTFVTSVVMAVTSVANAQQPPPQVPAAQARQFAPGSWNRIEDLPPGRLRLKLESLPTVARERALERLQSFHFPEQDLESLDVDSDGGILYVDEFTLEAEPAPAEPMEPAGAAVPVSPFPAGLKFHSKPGAPNTLYLNFAGQNVTGTAWNTSLGRTVIPAVAFSTDTDFSTFSDAEQLVIKRVWQRVAEDYAAFDIDVTTERPATFTTRTAHLLISRNTDANGAPNPSSGAGGVAYVNVFGSSSYASYRPAWVHYNNLGNNEAYISEAASHEVGHNLGLSHDGTTSSSYYGGHGSGYTSWGPLMGTGYNRNVSHWCKGDYYQANNTQDDLTIIAGKLAYRVDDHGDTRSAATTLALTGGTNIVSTTPENDPANINSANKGVLSRTTDVDVFSFTTGAGAVRVAVNPWITPSGTRGGNVDLLVELHNESGTLLVTSNPTTDTVALIQTSLAAGRYFITVKNSGAGSPFSSPPSGYTAYGSIGQYFISGYVAPSTSTPVISPVAQLQVTAITQSMGTKQFTVTYSDNLAIDVSSIDNNDVRVTGPNGYDRLGQFVSLNVSGNGTPRVATYAIAPPAGSAWTAIDSGVYTISMQPGQVRDTEGAWVAGGQLGQFNVTISAPTPVLYSANMNSNPGWTLEPQWAYGTSQYQSGNGPVAGATGSSFVGYNLGGNYAASLSTKMATTPLINCTGASSVTLRFQRWLRLKKGDTAFIQVSINGTTWTDVWRTTKPVSDNAWQPLQYTLPASAAGSPSVRIRWGLASNSGQSEIGWNLDDVELISGSATLATSTGKNRAKAGIEPVTAQHAVPHSWLAAYGFAQDPDSIEEAPGRNGIPLWQSYIAGLNPNDPASRLLLRVTPEADGSGFVLNWTPAADRVYTIWSSTDPVAGFAPLANASSLPDTVNSFTNAASAGEPARYYRIQVEKP
jgi:hypothetical protein